MRTQGGRLSVYLGVAILATTCSGFALWGSNKSPERKTNVTFASATMLKNGATLPAGNYRIEVTQAASVTEVKFYKEGTDFAGSVNTPDALGSGKLMATLKARVVSQAEKNAETEVETITRGNAQLLSTIRPGGWKEELVFVPGGRHASAGTAN